MSKKDFEELLEKNDKLNDISLKNIRKKSIKTDMKRKYLNTQTSYVKLTKKFQKSLVDP